MTAKARKPSQMTTSREHAVDEQAGSSALRSVPAHPETSSSLTVSSTSVRAVLGSEGRTHTDRPKR